MRQSRIWNRKMREEERKLGLEVLMRVPYEKIVAAYKIIEVEGEDFWARKAKRDANAKALGITSVELSHAYFAGKKEDNEP